MIVNFDLTQSENFLYSTKGATSKKRVEPGQMEFLLHAQAGFGSFNKVITHEVEHLPAKKK